MLTLAEFVERIKKGRIFTITFVKRSDGSVRTMNCRMGVEVHKVGEELPYDVDKKKLLMVYSLDAKGYRQIPIEGIQSATLDGVAYNYSVGEELFKEV